MSIEIFRAWLAAHCCCCGAELRCEACGRGVPRRDCHWVYRGKTARREVDRMIDGGALGDILVQRVETRAPAVRWTQGGEGGAE